MTSQEKHEYIAALQEYKKSVEVLRDLNIETLTHESEKMIEAIESRITYLEQL